MPGKNGPQPPYGTAIQQAIAQGDLAEMKQVAQQAEEFLVAHGDIRAALEVLKIEIHKLQHRQEK